MSKTPPLPAGIKTFAEFWPYYVREHCNPINRALHVCGTSITTALLVVLLLTQNFLSLPLVPVCGYFFAWVGHFGFERNRPATFRYPLFSLAGDFVMTYQVLTGKMRIKGLGPKN